MSIHAVTHSLPHRGPGASRARARWQPYASNLSLASLSRSPAPIYLHTPASSISSLSPSTVHLQPVSDIKVPPQQQPSLRDAQKTKYAAKLVDQAVKTLSETWHPDDIPSVFTACAREALCVQPESPPPSSQCATASNGLATFFTSRNLQLPSPMSPSSRPTPSPPAQGCESFMQTPDGAGASNLIPIKGFVHEVLRRSRTSTGVLQTALCYLEAVRSKVPELLRAEKVRPTTGATQQEAEPRIVPGLFEETSAATIDMLADALDNTAGPSTQTVRIGDTVLVSDCDEVSQPVPVAPRRQESSLPPLPALPSPLCCPRRTFLACLILASKFMQDRSYSNRAWAKLAGLPPREIGRCERALGEALEWRLWVGKLPSPSSSSSSDGASMGRTLSRSRSDGDVLCSPADSCTRASTAAWASGAAGARALAHFAPLPPPRPPPSSRTRGLQRSATVPTLGAEQSRVRVEPFFLPAAQGDGLGAYYDTRATPGQGCDFACAMDVEPATEVSPVLSTPTLTYSPMSSASSSSDGCEDRTIQMSMFIDVPTPACGGSSGPWVAAASAYTPANPAQPYGSYGFNPYFNTTYMDDSASGTFAGPTLPALYPVAAKKMALPSFAEAFPDPNLGVIGTGAQ